MPATITPVVSDDPDPREPGSGPPEYRVYGSGRRSRRREESRADGPSPADEPPPEYRVYRARPRGLLGRLRGEEDALGGAGASGLGGGAGSRPKRITPGRVLLYALLALVGWLLLGLVLFLISAQIEQSHVSPRAVRALASAGPLPTSANTVLVLGSDQRVKGTKEPGANVRGPSRSDTMLLLRVGGGKSARLSIPRDTVVDIPGHGRAKINAAYAYGGAALSIRTVDRFLGVRVNHLVEVNFANFPKFIDSLGGVGVKTGCVLSLINGGTRNGGYTLRLRSGEHHLSGKQALALARTRKNRCRGAKNEGDLTRARRQQQILQGIKSELVSPGAFLRLPWVSWTGPKAIRTDMGGLTLLGMFGALASSGTPPVRILRPDGVTKLPDGEDGLTISDAAKRRDVARFLRG